MHSRQVRNGKTYIYPITHVRLRTDLGVVPGAMSEAQKLGMTFPKYVLMVLEMYFETQRKKRTNKAT